ncbi:MAG: thermonuclease family protein [Bacteroidales bacterium]|nr:thermonuclease family protein [Bacteroidales bacterium]
MKRIFFILVISFLPVLCLAQHFSVKVIGISDGDTFTCINDDNLQLKIRINGIDAPEKRQAFGNKSKEFLSSLIFGKKISIDVQSKDGYGRYIAYVYSPEGKDVALLMLHEGMAWHFTKYDNSKVYSDAENVARKAKRGLWTESSPIAPWDFRAQSKKK